MCGEPRGSASHRPRVWLLRERRCCTPLTPTRSTSRHYELRQAGRLVQLEPRVFDLLAYLVQHPGRTVTTEELLEQLYPNQFAPVDRLTNAVAQARRALHDTGQTQRYIQTVRRRGYRFIASVEILQQAETDAQSPPAVAPPMPTEQHDLDQADAESPPPPVQSPPPSAPPSAPDPASAPRATRPVTPEAERRQLTVLVCRLVGVSERAKRLDPEELLEVAPDYHAIGAEVVRHFDGYIAQYQGDRLVVYFGYPQAHEDDARRAVHTGLGLVERMAELNRRRTRAGGVQLAVRVGIHTGVVVVGAMGQDERAPLALGDTPTIAAQVQDLAAPGTVVIGPTTLRLVEGYFDYSGVGRLYSRGARRTASRLPDPARGHDPEPVRGRGHERAHSTGGPRAGDPTAPRALGAGERRLGTGGLAERRGGDWQVTPGAGAHEST